MKTAEEIERAFDVYFREIASCEKHKNHWALLHVLVTLPDVCAALEGGAQNWKRYVEWCDAHFPKGTTIQPGDRYQMRCALLHEGTTLPDDSRAANPAAKTSYVSFSFAGTQAGITVPLHGFVDWDSTRAGKNLSVVVETLAQETREAMRNWFRHVEVDATANAVVESNLLRLPRVQPKDVTVPGGPGGGFMPCTNLTTSST